MGALSRLNSKCVTFPRGILEFALSTRIELDLRASWNCRALSTTHTLQFYKNIGCDLKRNVNLPMTEIDLKSSTENTFCLDTEWFPTIKFEKSRSLCSVPHMLE